MTEQTNGATGTLADPGTQPLAGTGETQAVESSGEQAQPDTISIDEAKKLRSEASALRRRLKEFEAADQARADAALTETERQTKRIADLESELASNRHQLARERTTGLAARLGFADPDDAVAIISRTDPDALAADGDGKAISEALAALAKAKPYLLVQATAPKPVGSFDAGNSAARKAQSTYTRAQLKDPAFYLQHKDDIPLALREGRIRD